MRLALTVLAFLASFVCLVDADDAAIRDAELALARGDHAKAIEILAKEAQASKEGQDYLYYMLGVAQLAADKPDDAVASFDRVIKDFPTGAWRTKATFRRADALAAKGDFAGAERVYEDQVASLRKEDRRQALAMMYVSAAREFLAPKKEGEPPDFAKALDLLLKAQDIGALGKETERVAYEVPFCQHKLGQHDPAVAGFDKLLKDAPKGEWAAAASFHRGLSLYQLNLFLEARDAWKKVVAEAPKSEWAPEALMEIGKSHARGANTEDVVRAVAAWRQLAKDYPKDDLAPQALGSIAKTYLSIRGMTREAYDAVEELLKAYPASAAAAEALHAKANDLLVERKYDEALAEYERFLKAFPQSAQFREVSQQAIDARHDKAYQAYLDKRYDDARKLFAAFLDGYPLDARDPQLMFLLGDMSHEAKKFDEAIAAWKKVVEKYPGSDEASHAQLSIAEGLANDQGKFEEALKEYAKVAGGQWQGVAQQRIQQLQGKALALLTERAIGVPASGVPASGPGAKATVKLTTRNVEKVKFKVYRVDLKDYFLKTVRAAGWDALDISLIAPDKEWDVAVEGYAKYKELAKDVELPFADAGAYVVTATEETLEAKTLVLVSDLAVVLKASQRGASAFVEDLKTGTAVEKPALTVGADGKLMADPAHYPNDKVVRDLSAFVSVGNQLAGIETNIGNLLAAAKPLPKGFLMLDRATFRPGERVNLWAILRDASDAGYALPAKDKKVTLTATLADGQRYWKQDFFAGDFGTFSGSIDLDKAMPGGPVQITMKWKDQVLATAGFSVGEYRDQEYTIEFAAPKSVKAGEKVLVTMTLLDAEGRPAAGRKIAYRVNEIGQDITGITDENGQMKVEVDSNRYYWEDFVFIYASPWAGRKVGKMVKVIDPGYRVSLKDLRGVYVAEEPVAIAVEAKGYDDKPRATKLAFRVLHLTDAGEKEVAKGEVQTDDKEGKGTAKFDAKEGGLYRIDIEGRDARNLPIVVQGKFSVSDGKGKDETRLHAWTTNAKVKAGESAQIEVYWRGEKALALVSVEASEVILTQQATLAKGMNKIEVKLGDRYLPIFRIATTVIADNKTHSDTVGFTMERELTVKVEPSAPLFHPGDEAKVNISVTNAEGKPVAANVVVLAYDDEWEPVTGEAGKSLDATFFPRDANGYVLTASSVPFRYEGGGQARDTQLLAALSTLEAESRYRNAPVDMPEPEAVYAIHAANKGVITQDAWSAYQGSGGRYGGRFGGKQNLVARGGGTTATRWSPRDSLPAFCPALVFWNASVTTDRNGKATVTIAVPDRIGHVKVLAIAAAKDSSFGRGDGTLRVSQAVNITLDSPRELREGDKASARVVLRTTEKDGKEVELKLTVRQGGQDKTQVEKFKFSGTVTHEYPIEATAAGAGYVQVSIAGQSVRKPLTISPWAVPVEKTSGAEVSAKTTVSVQVPPAKDAEHPSLDVFVTRGDVEFLRFLTHGEYIDNGVMADLARLVARVDTKALVAHPKQSGKYSWPLDAEISDGARHMMLLQNPDGGWPWQQGPMRNVAIPVQTMQGQSNRAPQQQAQQSNEQEAQAEPPASDIFVTAVAFHVLSRIEKAGNKDLTPHLDRAAEWLRREFSDTEDNDLKAVCLVALSARSEATIFAYANRLYRGKETLSARALALTAITFAQINKAAEAKEMLALFTKKAIEKDGLCHWEMAQDDLGALSSSVELTALGVEAMALVTPADPKVGEGWTWLLSQRTGHGWGTAVETLLAADVSTILAAGRADFALPEGVVVSVNGKAIATVGSGDGIAWGRVRVPAGSLKEGANEVVLEPKGAGRFEYVTRLSYGTPGIAATAGEVPFELKRTFDPSNLRAEGEEIASGYSVVRGTVTPLDNPLDRVTAQETYGVHLNLKVKDAKLRYFLVEEPIPAGCAVVAGSVSGGFAGYAVQRDRITFRVRRTDEEEFDLSYRLYALHGGAYRVPPTRIASVWGGRDVRLGGRKDAFAVLPVGKDSREGIKSTPDELYALGKRAYDKKEFAKALVPLADLLAHWKLQDASYTDVSRMLLYIYLDKKDSENVVRFFEIMKEKDPAVVIPFDDIVRIGGAYREMKELERGMQVFRGTADAYFLQEANIAGSLEALGKSRSSVEFVKKLALSYADTETVRLTLYSLGGDLFRRAKGTPEGPKPADAEKYTRAELLDESVRLLRASLRENPAAKTADEVAFTLGNAYLEQEAYESAEAWSKLGWDKYKDSRFHHSFEYMEAYALFALKKYDDALKTIDIILAANNPGPSEYAPQARHMMGQIFHAMGQVEKAIAAYREVKASFPDAARAIDYLEKQALSLPEVTTLGVKEWHEVEIESRGVGEVTLKAYKVDLMMLYLKQRNLNDVTKVNLAGVKPVWEKSVKLQDGSQFKKETTKVEVEVEGPGAFLLIARSGDISCAGMLLSTDLTLDVQEDPGSGVVRTNVVGRADGKFVENAKVSGLGSKDPSFFHARTDLRGVAELSGLHGFPTVIVEKDGHYGFYRGHVDLAMAEAQGQQETLTKSVRGTVTELKNKEALEQLEKNLQGLNDQQNAQWTENSRKKQQGCEVERTK